MSLLGFVLYKALISITMDTVSCHSCLWRPAEINRKQRIPFSPVSIITNGDLLCLVSVYDQMKHFGTSLQGSEGSPCTCDTENMLCK